MLFPVLIVSGHMKGTLRDFSVLQVVHLTPPTSMVEEAEETTTTFVDRAVIPGNLGTTGEADVTLYYIRLIQKILSMKC